MSPRPQRYVVLLGCGKGQEDKGGKDVTAWPAAVSAVEQNNHLIIRYK